MSTQSPVRRRPTRRPQNPYTKAAAWAFISLLAFFAAGVYFAEPAKALPVFLPGQQPGQDLHLIQHAVVAGVIGVFSLFATLVSLITAGAPPRQPVRISPDARGAHPHIRSIPPQPGPRA